MDSTSSSKSSLTEEQKSDLSDNSINFKPQFRQAKLKPQLKPVLYQNSHVRKQSLSVSPPPTGIRNYKSFVVQSVNRESSRERLQEIIKQSQKERARSIRWSVLVE